jgi:hypothetical protein
MLAALTTLAIGAILGVLLGLDAAGRIDLPSGIYGAHPSTMVVGYLILAGLAMVEWRLAAPGRPARGDRAGVAQVALPFLAGLALMAGSLFDVFALLVINVPLEVAGVVVFLVRVGRRIRAVRWLQPGPERQFGLAALFLVVNILLIAYVIARYAEDFDTIPAWLLFALDHSMFIGVMTNSLFGLILVAGAERRGIWRWAEDVLFWGVNAGLIGFIVGLLTESSPLKRTFSPILGLSLLLGMLVLAQRLRGGGSAVAGRPTAGPAPSA